MTREKREITKEEYTKANTLPKEEAEEMLFNASIICGYGLYWWATYQAEEADGTHYWLVYNVGD